MPASVTELEVAGVRYGGWKKIQIRRAIENISGSFELEVTDRWAEQQAPRPIVNGQSCRVLVDGAPVITGYVDVVKPRFDKDDRGISVSGRDTTADLVDCAAVHLSGQWSNVTLLTIAQNLCVPFGIQVVDQVNVAERFTTFALEEGETAFEAIERAARMRGVLLIPDGRGRLVITRAGTLRVRTPLVQGENILQAEGEFNSRERFSKYIVKGQSQGSDQAFGADVASQKGEAADAGVTRYRPLIVLAEDQGGVATFQRRAEWERNVRAGRGSRATITVQSWRHADGLWQPNQLVRVASTMLSIDADLLIASVTYTLDDKGTRTELELCRREAYDVIAAKSKKSVAAVWQ